MNNQLNKNNDSRLSTIDNELSKTINKLVLGIKKRDKKKIETLLTYKCVDTYKFNITKEVMNELGIDRLKDLKTTFQVERSIEKEILSNRVSSGEESNDIGKYIKELKGKVGFVPFVTRSNYKSIIKDSVDIELKEDEYLSDKFYEFIDNKWGITLDNINDPNISLKLLIDSPMGSGKSTLLGMMKNIVILKDSIVQVKNSVKDLKDKFKGVVVYEEHGTIHNEYFEEGSIIVSTYNQIVNLDSKLGSEWLFILDEEHKLVVELSFKESVIHEVVSVLEKRGRYISMSGTPLKYGPLKYDQVVRVSKESNKEKEIVLLSKGSDLEGKLFDYLLGINDTYIKEKTTLFFIIQDTSVVERLSKEIRDRFPTYNVCEITSDLVNGRIDGREKEGNEIMDNISSGGFSEYDVVITTPLLREGVSLSTNREESIFIMNNDPNVLTILQQHDRVRKCSKVRVVMMDKKEVKDVRGEFKPLFKRTLVKDKTIKEIDFYGDLTIDSLKSRYRSVRSKVYEYYNYDVELDIDTLNKGLHIIKLNLLNKGVNVVDYPSGETIFLDKDFEEIVSLQYINDKLERCFFNSEVRNYLELVKGFKFTPSSSKTKIDKRGNKEKEKNIRREKLEYSIEKIFKMSIEDLKKMKNEPRDKYTNEVYYSRLFLSKVSTMDDIRMKDFILNSKPRSKKELVRDWLIFTSTNETNEDNDTTKNTRQMIETRYLDDHNLKIEYKLGTKLKVGQTYTKEEILDIIHMNGGNDKNPSYKLREVFKFTTKEVRIGDRKDNKREYVYEIVERVIDGEGYNKIFNEDYLNDRLESVYKILMDEIEERSRIDSSDVVLINPFKK